jgi:hypothetical protein
VHNTVFVYQTLHGSASYINIPSTMAATLAQSDLDDARLFVERSADFRNVAAVLRRTFVEQSYEASPLKNYIMRFRTNMEEVHEILAERHGAGLAADSLEEFHCPHIVGPRRLNTPGALAR